MFLTKQHRTCKSPLPIFLSILILTSTACAWVTTRLFPGQAAEHYRDGVVAFSQGDYEQAIAKFTEAIQLDATSSEVYYARADAYFVLGNLEQAIADYARAIELGYHPLSYAYATRGDVNMILGRYSESREDYNSAYAADSDYADTYAQQRVQTFSKVIELNPELAIGYYARGWAYYWLGESEAALDDCSRAIELKFDPLSRGYAACGFVYYAMGDFPQAILQFNKALELDPQAADVLSARSSAYARQGDYAQVVADLRAAIALDPDYALAHNNLCWYASLLGEAAEVMESCERAVLLEPNVPAFYDSRGLARALTGDFAGAIEDFRYYVEASRAGGYYDAGGAQREAWIAELEAGRNPFDESTLDDLLNQ